MYLENMNKGEIKALIKDTFKELISEHKQGIISDVKSTNEYSTIKETAEYFKVTPQTIHTSWIKKGLVTKYKIGGRSLLKIKEIEIKMKDTPYLFGKGRDYSYRSPDSYTLMNKERNKYYNIKNKLNAGKEISTNEKIFYEDYLIKQKNKIV